MTQPHAALLYFVGTVRSLSPVSARPLPVKGQAPQLACPSLPAAVLLFHTRMLNSVLSCRTISSRSPARETIAAVLSFRLSCRSFSLPSLPASAAVAITFLGSPHPRNSACAEEFLCHQQGKHADFLNCSTFHPPPAEWHFMIHTGSTRDACHSTLRRRDQTGACLRHHGIKRELQAISPDTPRSEGCYQSDG